MASLFDHHYSSRGSSSRRDNDPDDSFDAIEANLLKEEMRYASKLSSSLASSFDVEKRINLSQVSFDF